ELLEIPSGIFFHLHQIVSSLRKSMHRKWIIKKEPPSRPKFRTFGPNFLQHLIKHEKMAFLLSFCKNFNFTDLFINVYRKSWRPALIFYIGKIVKRNPNINLHIDFLPISFLYKNFNVMNSIYPKL